MNIHPKLLAITVGGLFLKFIVVNWATRQMVGVFDRVIKKLLRDNAEEMAIWLHYRKKRTIGTHQYPNPLRCPEEDCQLVKLN